MGVHGSEDERPEIVHEIDRWARLQPALRVYVLSGDEPDSIGESLTDIGFSLVNQMVQMAWFPVETLGREEWTPANCQDERRTIASFMVQQFFAMNAADFRNLVVETTTTGPHELWQIIDERSVVAAAMVSPSQTALGIYNVCVDSSLRRRGYGTALMRSAQIRAHHLQLPIVLQCDASLSEWYRELGFQVFGEMRTFQRRN